MDAKRQARQRWIVVGLSVAVAATRILALSRSPWDWDEILFCLALRDGYDVGQHHPHPPGFPLYIAIAKLVRLVTADDFHALRTVQFLAACFLFPSMFALGRALKFPFTLALSAALLFSFTPNIWFYGGTAFSDILNLMLFLAGAAALFAAREKNGWRYLGGTALFSLSLLVRPQNVIMSFPWFAATWPRLRARRRGAIVASMLLSIAIVAIGYGAAAYVTGPATYVYAVHKHGEYVSRTDGFFSPTRQPLRELFGPFAVNPYEGGKAPRLLFGFAVAALFRPKRRDGDVLATFGPALLFAWFMMNPMGISRHSMAYQPMMSLLAVDGMAFIGETLSMVVARPRAALAFVLLCVIVIAGRFITWTLPALRVVRATISPPVQAMLWIRSHVPRGSTVFAGGAVTPHADYYLTGYDLKYVDDTTPVQPLRNAWFVGDGPTGHAGAVAFTRDRRKLSALFMQRCFETDVEPVTGAVKFLDGWYGEEEDGVHKWRWMGAEGRLQLEALRGGGELDVGLSFPPNEAPPAVTVSVDGKAIDRFVPPMHGDVARRYDLAGSVTPHLVTFDVNRTINLQRQHVSDDPRDLGMQLNAVTWRP